jgi:hypothetical protein
MDQFDQETKHRLEHECSSLFYSSIDFVNSTPENAILAYDMLYQIYCTKFLQLNPEEEIRDDFEEDGRLGLIAKTKEWKKKMRRDLS